MIILNKLNKKYNDTDIYIDSNYTFKDNSLTCFLGASGSGKTTLLNLIAGFDRDYNGEININGINIKNLTDDELSEYRMNNVGFIFQNYNTLKGYTAIENVLMGIYLNNSISEREKRKKASDLLRELGLKEQINQRVETLSGGQNQRVAIARALINNPKIILADEPTGALDSEATNNIMEILKSISNSRTVIIITHDEEVAKYADEVIELENYNISTKKTNEEIKEIAITKEEDKDKSKLNKKTATNLSIKNFKIHIFKFLIAAIIIALGSSAFVSSLSSKNITSRAVDDFKEKNVFYNIGQVPLYEDGKQIEKDIKDVFNTLNKVDEIENVYYQYDLENIKIKNKDKFIDIPVKIPTATSKETMAYGSMPLKGKNEIAISSNIANRLVDDIKDIIGKEITFEITNKEGKVEKLTLTVSGLTNSQYQDFVLSTDVEKKIYNKIEDSKNPTAISFDIKNFEDIPKIDDKLKDKGIGVFTKAIEVEAFQKSFTSLLKLYTAIAYLILIVGILISIIILYKISIDRYVEVGLLGALGYSIKNIKRIMFRESIYFAVLSTIISCLLIFVIDILYKSQFGYGLDLDLVSFIILICMNVFLTIFISSIINIKLIKTEPAQALKK